MRASQLHQHGAQPEHDHADHGHHGHDHIHVENASEKRLLAALALLFVFTAVEAVGGFWANSIALVAEAAHMFADCASLLLAIIAIRVSQRPASPHRTYGHRRYQTLAAYTNGLVLLAITVGVVVQGIQRLIAPPPVDGRVMLGIALVGGIANLAAFLVLSGASSLNERGARAHILSDLLGSGAAIAAAGVILALGWLSADPLLSLAVSVLILRSGWQLTRDSAHVLLEGAPVGFDTGEVERELNDLPGVCGVHHVHVWSITGEAPMLTLHVQLIDGADRQQILAVVMERLRLRFGVDHATVQLEEGECVDPVGIDDCHNPSMR